MKLFLAVCQKGGLVLLKLLLGRSGTGKSEKLLRRISEECKNRPQLLIVPEQHSHDAERALCETGGNAVSLHAEVLSFTRLASRVFAGAGGMAELTLDAGGRLLLMDAALKSVRDHLRIYSKPSQRPQFLTQLIATVDECKSAGITPEKLLDAAEANKGAAGDKFFDLSLIYEAYNAFCEVRGNDPRDRLTKLAHALDHCLWARDKDIYLDNFTDFTAQERAVLERLLRQARSVTVALTCDGFFPPENGEIVTDIFLPARRTAHRLSDLAKRMGVRCEVETLVGWRIERAEGIAAIESYLFHPLPAAVKNSTTGVEFYRALTPWSEVERCAAELSRLVRDEGYRYRDLTVGVRSMERYGPLIERIFPQYGLPFFLSQMDDVLQKPILTLVTAALDTAAADYRYEDLFRYLKTGLTGLAPDEVDRLENYVLKWELRGNVWSQKKPWDKHPQGYGIPWTEKDKREVAELDALRRRVIGPLEDLRKAANKTAEDLSLALYGFLEEIGLAERLTARAEQLCEEGDAALAAEYRQLWTILCNGLEQCANLLGKTPMEWDEFSRLFKLVLSQYQVGSIPVSLDRLTAGDFPRLAHKRCKVVYLLGCDDDAIPAVVPSPGLLADEDRELLAQLGMETAPQLDQKLWREMTILYETCALPTERLIFSWSRTGLAGDEKRPAFFIQRARALLPELHLVTEEGLPINFRLTAPRPALALAGRMPAVAANLKKLSDYAPLVERMEKGARLERGRLHRSAVDALYGDRVPMSASRMDKYRSCHFSYFMQYALKAVPRRSAGFRAPEYGTFVHYVLEHILRERKGGEMPSREAVSAVIRRYVNEELGGLDSETPRFRYLFQRLEKSVYAVVENVCQELAGSSFQPIAFELGFGSGKDLPPVELSVDGVTVLVTGFVDRVDGYEKDGKLYLRVVDYKTGRKSFDLTDVWNGLGLQMLLYLFTLKEKGQNLFGQEIVPAGVLYLPAREALLKGTRNMSEATRCKLADRELTRKGLVLEEGDVIDAMERKGEDGFRFLPIRVLKSGQLTGEALVTAERLGQLEKHIHQVLTDIAAEVAAGTIAADPYWRGPSQNACRFCDYAAACQFREGVGGDARRWFPKMPAGEFWERLGKHQSESEGEA